MLELRLPSSDAGRGLGRNVLALSVPVAIIALCVFSLLPQKAPGCAHTGETRCRLCGYILRGLSEPRCPECGEKI